MQRNQIFGLTMLLPKACVSDHASIIFVRIFVNDHRQSLGGCQSDWNSDIEKMKRSGRHQDDEDGSTLTKDCSRPCLYVRSLQIVQYGRTTM